MRLVGDAAWPRRGPLTPAPKVLAACNTLAPVLWLRAA